MGQDMIKKVIEKLNGRTINSFCRSDVKHKIYESNQILVYECCTRGYNPFWVLFTKHEFLSCQRIKILKFLYEKNDVVNMIRKYEKWPKYDGGFQEGELENE